MEKPGESEADGRDDEPPLSEAEAAAEEPPEAFVPAHPSTYFLAGLFLLAVLTALYAAAEIVLPFVLAVILKLLLQPALRCLERVHVPRVLGTLLIILALFGLVVGVGAGLSVPAQSWAAKLPEGVPRLQQRLSFLREPVDAVSKFMQHAESMARGETMPAPETPATQAAPASVGGASLTLTLFSGTRAFAGGLFTMLLLLFFLLMSGDTFLRRLVEILPRFSDKRQAVEISQEIEHDISAYLATITMMNIAVGLGTALMTWLLGLQDPVLWGVMAFLLNYVPILGPVVGAAIFLLVGLLSLDPLWRALLVAPLYLLIHVTESTVVTPMLLARRFTLNPVLVIMSLFFWNWMWGVVGMILAVPMLAIIKIVCGRIRPLAAVSHFLEG